MASQRTRKPLRSGMTFGDWLTNRKLGGGGNGEVWEVKGPSGERCAIKVLNVRNRDRLERFTDEVRFLIKNPRRPGILPLIDSQLSAEPGSPPWYVMPKATLIRKALGDDPEPAIVIEAMASIAETLAALAKEQIGHRDIKPDNLFKYGEDWVIGDFGLVTYPNKDPRTQHGRKLGPADYMAPEMRRSPDTAQAEPADVYSFAKTLWVLLTGHKIPLPGPHRADDPMCAVTNALKYSWSPELDRLIESCTNNDPSSRSSMQSIANELRRMCSEPPEQRNMADTAEFEARIAAITDTDRRVEEKRGEYQNLIARAANELNDNVINPYANHLCRKLSGFRMLSNVSQHLAAAALLPAQNFFRVCSYNWTLIAPGSQEGNPCIVIAGSLCVLDETGRCVVAMLVQVNTPNHGRGFVTNVYKRVDESQIGSASLKLTIREIRTEVYAATPDLLKAYLALIGDGNGNLE